MAAAPTTTIARSCRSNLVNTTLSSIAPPGGAVSYLKGRVIPVLFQFQLNGTPAIRPLILFGSLIFLLPYRVPLIERCPIQCCVTEGTRTAVCSALLIFVRDGAGRAIPVPRSRTRYLSPATRYASEAALSLRSSSLLKR